ncbi:hypothetical protein NE237_025684 [Protea cynaroides]|uniref:2-oxoglutarate-dependent dioxygenase DAO n=1 Tax=Protea cynaroides TaxID=273540 RepID=A0A9Q0H2T1_9MAGN|nr:hypothetical protein NE237_025684 [Protea cynaroides]
MGGYNHIEGEIPYIDLPKELLESKQWSSTTEEWKELCGKVREACEDYGCFTVGYDEIFPAEQREEFFMCMKDLFDLPYETKQKNSSDLHPANRGYIATSVVVPLYESLGVQNPIYLGQAQAFTDLMWPDGNPAFCRSMNSLSRNMRRLELLSMRMVLESYGIPTYYEAVAENSVASFRMMKYRPPPATDEVALGLIEHTDKSFLTILCKEQVKGFELLTKQGHWLQFSPLQKGNFLVIVGEIFEAWSNRKVRALEHRVVMRGDKARYSCALFMVPKDEEMIEVAKEFVDDDHPLLFRPFNFAAFVKYYNSNATSKNALQVYAGV